MGERNKQDLSSFMSILIMTIGCLTILLVANTLIIASNPDNLEIVSPFAWQQPPDVGSSSPTMKRKQPSYIDVGVDALVIYPEKQRVRSAELERKENAFRRMLDRMESEREDKYIVMILRPRSAVFARQLRSLIRARDIDIGQELYEAGEQVRFDGGASPEQESAKR